MSLKKEQATEEYGGSPYKNRPSFLSDSSVKSLNFPSQIELMKLTSLESKNQNEEAD